MYNYIYNKRGVIVILRKPYAFFIKFFRFFHLILTILAGYLLYRTFNILAFYNDYTSTTISVIGQELKDTLMYGIIYLVPILSIITTLIIVFILIFKKKPIIFYIFNLIIYISTIVILILVSFNLTELNTNLIDIRVVRGVRDMVSISFMVQIVNIFVLVIRTVGLDLKKFDFKGDLQGLEITEADNEEFEFELKFDANKTKRKFRYFIRKAKYTYLENKLFSHILIVGTILTLSFGTYLLFTNNETILNQNQYFTANLINMKINNTYLITTDNNNQIITEDYFYLIVNIDIKKNTTSKKILEYATTKIVIDNYSYTPSLTAKDKINEFGEIYIEQELNEDYEQYTLIYEIPIELKERDMIFEFVDNTTSSNLNLKTVKVNINYVDLTENFKTTESSLTQNMTLKNDYIGEYTFNINSIKIENIFSFSYEYCRTTCYQFQSYIYPKIDKNYRESIMEIRYQDSGEENITNVHNLFDLIENYGYLEYTVNGETKIFNTYDENKFYPNETQNILYIDVSEELKNATEIVLILNIKNEKYLYKLK